MLDRTVAPAFRQIEHISIKEADKIKIGPGIDMYTINAGTQPVIKLELVFESGKWGEKKAGAAFFTGKMLKEGTGKLRSFDISNIFDSLGAHLDIIPTLDYTSIAIHSLEKHLEQLLPVVRSLIETPTFPKEELETFQNIQIQTLRVNNEKNSFLASKKLREVLFGSHHPYGHILEESHITSIQQQDLKQHFQDIFFEKPFTIIASGLLESNTIQYLKDSFLDIKVGEPGVNATLNAKTINSNVTIDKEESSQSSLRMGCLSIPMEHSDYNGLVVTNEILGGYFGSRLMKNIREEKGLTYGIYSSLASLRNATFFSISADVKKDLRELAFEEIGIEIRKMRNELVSQNELETVRNYMLGQIQASINTPFSLASKFKNVHFNGLDYGYYSDLINTIKSISSEDIIDLSDKYLREDNMVQVCVG